MTEPISEIYGEIWLIHHKEKSLHERYRKLNRILERCVKQLTANYKVDFTNFSSRLHHLCKAEKHDALPLEIFRSRIVGIRTGDYAPIEKEYAHDLKAVCEAIAVFYKEPIPTNIKELLPNDKARTRKRHKTASTLKRVRLTVSQWDEHYIYGTSTSTPTLSTLKVCYHSEDNDSFVALHEQLYEGAQVNLINVKTIKNSAGEEVLIPELVILDPDFIIDITALCGCIRPYGISAYTYLLNKFAPAPKSAAIQLGNAANQFLDDCVNEESVTDGEEHDNESYLQSLRKSFSTFPIVYTILEDIDQQFFEQCQLQFNNIKKTIRESFSTAEVDIKNTDVQLEPSFVCEALGIQGRMDLLTTDYKKIIELKSGKAEEYPYRHPRLEHCLQMALYKEILYHNADINDEDVSSYLFYSRYPQFYVINTPRTEIKKMMALRNAIVHLEHRLRDGQSEEVLKELDEDHLNVDKRNDRFYINYLRPQIIEVTRPIKKMDGIEAEYFHHFLTFIEREQFLAKIGDSRPDSSNGFAETWNCDCQTKWENGNILTDLNIMPKVDEKGNVTHIRINLPKYDMDFLPNFRQGDMVMLYERNTEGDLITNKQFFRCLIEEIHNDYFLLKLSYVQRNVKVFNCTNRYAIEPGYMDSSFNQAYSGLFKLLKAPRRRKELLLGQRAPERDKTVTLNGSYLNDDISRIVLKAKQAKDYFLLIGPPGTGKTSVALKSMVEEFLTEAHNKTILLMAYTNRAVDEICGMLSTIEPSPDYIRIGQELNCEEEYRKHLLCNVISSATTRKEIYETLIPVRIFVSTISSMCGNTELFDLKPIDVAIIDEASQVLEPQLLPLLCAGTKAHDGSFNLPECAIKKFILIGDHKQLPAVVSQSVEQSAVNSPSLNAIGLTNCRNSLFERLHTLQHILGREDFVALLHRQGRMHPMLSDYVNKSFYNSQLDIIPLEHQTGSLEFSKHDNDEWSTFVAMTRIGMIDVEDTDNVTTNNKSNKKEAEIVVDLIATLYKLYNDNGITPEIGKRIGVIVPFRAQIAMIKNLLAETALPDATDITIDTVERYQGSQRDIILFSSTIKQYYQLAILSEPILTDGIWIDRKLNVAITRGRKQFFLVGNGSLLQKCPAYKDFIDYIYRQDGIFKR